MNIEILQEEIRRTLKMNSTERTELSTSWKLDSKRLAFVETSPFLFTQKKAGTWKKYNLEIVIDVSSSMYNGTSMPWAIEAAQELIKLFYWVIDFDIYVFWLIARKVSPKYILSLDVEKLKGYGHCVSEFRRWCDIVKINWVDEMVEMEGGSASTDYGTSELQAVINSVNRLKSKEWEGLTILIWDGGHNDISWHEGNLDGLPTDEYNRHTRVDKITEAEGNGANILPIAIGYDHFSDYKDGKYIKEIKDLFPIVIEYISDKFWH